MKSKKISTYLTSFLLCSSFLLTSSVKAQQSDRNALIETLEKEGCAVTDDRKVKICKFDYKYKNKTVEALTVRPNGDGKFPSLFPIPGYKGTPQNSLTTGVIFAKLGFASMIVGTPGFGKTELKPEFLGKTTIKAFIEGYKKFKQESFVDKDKLGVFGYSRGAIAASLFITQVKDVKAAVLGGGIYDLKKAYDELTIEGIRENIKAETGLTEKTFRERSVVFHAKKINCPVLIVHGEKDLNAPPNQAYLLRDKLTEVGKDFEFQIVAGKNHSDIGGDFLTMANDFFSRKLKGVPSNVKIR
ncbi:MAG: prolyl oligopeptidase family serine peptidase [Acidobacteriota bacterium]|nr:prolyl oligopeptidase family serine peptidase [Acidobacteriota bacterium]